MKDNHKLSNSIFYTLLFSGFAYFFYIILNNPDVESIWKYFSDSYDYKKQSEYSIFSLDFFIPKPSLNFSPRSFTIPLFYKIAGSDPYKMVILQKTIYSISVLVLVFSIINNFSNKILKLIGTYILLYFFTWWNIVGWTNNILTESVSMSLMLLWFAFILFYFKKQSLTNLFFIVIVSTLLSFSRDTWPYILVLFSIINLFTFQLLKKGSIKRNLILTVFSFALLFAQGYISNIGEHHKYPVFNSIVARVSQTDEYINWFKKEGMPLSDSIVKNFRGLRIDTDENRGIAYSKYNDSTYAELFNWVIKDGKNSYKKFLITHPSYFFLSDQSAEQKEKIFSANLFGYTQAPKGFFLNANNIFPCFSISFLIVLLVLLAILVIRNKKQILLFPLILFILFSFNALLSYNADGLEVERHLIVTQIMVEFISIISLLLITDLIIENYQNPKRTSKKVDIIRAIEN